MSDERGPFRRFVLNRRTDVTGISGVGIVAQGVEFSDGVAVVRWLEVGLPGVRPTTVVHDGTASIEAIHGHGGATQVEWID